MALELKDVLAEFDIPNDAELTLEKIREIRDEKYIGRAVAHQDEQLVNKIIGSRMGGLETSVKRLFKESGYEFSKEEIEGKKIEDVVALGMGKISASIEDLKKKSSEGSDKKLQDALKQHEELQKKLKEQEELLTNSNKLLQDKESEFNNNIKQFKINHKVGEIKSKFTYSDTVDDFKKRGFDAVFGEKYKVDMEDDNLVVMDARTGQKIKNATGTGFLGFEDVLKSELESAKMLKVNGASGSAGNGGNGYTPPATNGQAMTPNPKAIANAERLRNNR